MKNHIVVGAVLAALAVVIGAFGAHALKKSLSPDELEIFATGSKYHFYHALALIIYGIYGKGQKQLPSWPGWTFVVGIVLFSGSLYALAVFKLSKLGMITPLGGLAFIVGWVGFALAAHRESQ